MLLTRLPVLLILFPCIVESQNRYDIIIDEIMADPSPQVGLPNNEWIELKNTSSVPVNIQNWRIGDQTGQSGPLPNFVLQPDSFVIVCTGSAVTALQPFGTTISVTSFPSLDNAGDQLYLKSSSGIIIHAVRYSDTWYQNSLKAEGGWTLEMIDTFSPCAGIKNWKASTDASGGSPGRKNSVDAINPDQTGPALIKVFSADNSHLIAVFDEPIDSLSGSIISNYSLDGGLSVQFAVPHGPLFDRVELQLSASMQAGIIYHLVISNVNDCRNNPIISGMARTGVPGDAVEGDIIVNEILFNPRSGGSDYVEFYNRSDKILDAGRLYIANRNSSGAISSTRILGADPFYIFPGDYPVVTENAVGLSIDYLVKSPEAVLEISSLPSFPDNEGVCVILNFQGDVLDEVAYKDDWQFALIDNHDGVALERIDPEGSSQDAGNWHSAASTAGYGTPTYKNSQYKLVQPVNAKIEATPKLFSPDNDGKDDIATIRYKTTEPGYVANITIYDAHGRPVRYLVKNGTMGLEGSWTWDGLDEKRSRLYIGTYIIFTEIFNLQGKKEAFKNVVVLARMLH